MAEGEKILLATDGSKEARIAAERAIKLAETEQAELHVVHVTPLRGFIVSPNVVAVSEGGATEFHGEVRERGQSVLDQEVKYIEQKGGKVAQAHLRAGDPAKEILRLCDELSGVDTIVIGSRGLGAVGRALMGSVSDQVVRNSKCPVLIVRE